MARPGVKSRWTDATRKQVADMLDKGISQTDIARAFDTTQQTISRLAQTIKREGAEAIHDETDPIGYVASFETYLAALQAVTHAHDRHSPQWNSIAFQALQHRTDRPVGADDGPWND